MENKVIKDCNFFTIQGWMVSRLNLKGNELLVYAIIYGFSQKEDAWYDGSHTYLADWLSSSKQTVCNSLNSLLEKGYIDKKEVVENGVRFCRYKASFLPTENCFDPIKKFDRQSNVEGEDPIKNFDTLSKKEGEIDEKFDTPYQNILPTHITKNIYKNNKEKGTVFSKPTLSEIEEYCKAENIKIDAYQFYHFYESKDWMVGKTKMKRWRSAVRTWENRNKPKNQSNSNFDNQKDPEGFNELFK